MDLRENCIQFCLGIGVYLQMGITGVCLLLPHVEDNDLEVPPHIDDSVENTVMIPESMIWPSSSTSRVYLHIFNKWSGII